MAQGTLSHLGHDVAIANHGLEALEISKERGFDLILMDLNMPEMDGFEASRAILDLCQERQLPAPPIVALTATLTDPEKEKCRAHGMTSWLTKPIDIDEFQEFVLELRGAHQEDKAPWASTGIQSNDLLDRIKNPQALTKIVELFCQSYPDRLRELQSSLNPEGSVVARRAAHTLKGNFLNFASPAGAQVAQEIEAAISQTEWGLAQDLLPRLTEQCEIVAQELRGLIDSRPDEHPESAVTKVLRIDFSVLVADVDPANRAICSSALQAQGYEVVEASDGEQVLQILSERDIDVVLMGVFMQRLGGFETCRRIKAQENTKMVPVLLVTALDERAARIKGMDAGADDFINKPIDPTEVSLRVRNAARGKGLYDQLQTSFEDLKRLEELRDGLTHMLVHDLRTPLTAIKGYASLLVAGFGAGLTPQQKNFAEKIVTQSNRLVEMVSAILDVSRLESDQMPLETQKTDLSLLLLEQSEPFSGLPDCEIHLDIADGVTLKCDPDLIKRVVANLLSNAFKYTPKGEGVTLRLEVGDEFAEVQILDKGPGVPEESRDKIFEKFTQVEGEAHKRPYSSGLGLTFCQLVVQKHGGEIGVGEADGGGAKFWFTLPLQMASS